MKPLLMYEARSENQISDPKDLPSQVNNMICSFILMFVTVSGPAQGIDGPLDKRTFNFFYMYLWAA